MWAEAKNLLDVMNNEEMEDDSSTASTVSSTSIQPQEYRQTTENLIEERPTNATYQVLTEDDEEEAARFSTGQGETVNVTATEQIGDDVSFGGAIVAVA